MSVLIKGVEMPTRCGECPCAYSTEGAYWDTCQAVDDQNDIEQFWKSGRPDWCPLVEVPKHGRLIDADEFEKYVELEYETREISHPNWIKFRVWCGDQPTVIEAEGRE